MLEEGSYKYVEFYMISLIYKDRRSYVCIFVCFWIYLGKLFFFFLFIMFSNVSRNEICILVFKL